VHAQTEIEVATTGRGLFDVTTDVTGWVAEQGAGAGLLIQENADPDVLSDLENFFARLVPDDPALYRHTTEGADDMPAKIRSALTQTQLSIPVASGAPVLGTWQGIYLYEHRTRGHRRRIVLHLMGD